MNKIKLQKMYDTANWSGYAMHKGEKWHTSRILDKAKQLGVKLEYNCPA